MKKHHIRPILLIIILLAWLLIPHYITGTAGYAALAALSILTILCFYKTRSWQSQQTVSDKTAKQLSNICLGMTMGLLFISTVIIIISASMRSGPIKVLSLLSSGVFVLEWCIYTVVCRTSKNVLRVEVSLSLAVLDMGACFLFLILEQGKGLRPFLRLIAIIACLAICLMAYITYQVPMKNIVFEVGWGGCIVMAALLTIVLNVQFCSNTYTVETYYVEGNSRSGMTCTLSDNYTFNYHSCPTPVGCTGRINQYDGWFHISFLAE